MVQIRSGLRPPGFGGGVPIGILHATPGIASCATDNPLLSPKPTTAHATGELKRLIRIVQGISRESAPIIHGALYRQIVPAFPVISRPGWIERSQRVVKHRSRSIRQRSKKLSLNEKSYGGQRQCSHLHPLSWDKPRNLAPLATGLQRADPL